MSESSAYGQCPICKELVRLKNDKTLRAHGYARGSGHLEACLGSGQLPADLQSPFTVAAAYLKNLQTDTASSSRDFGRGFAHAIYLLEEAT